MNDETPTDTPVDDVEADASAATPAEEAVEAGDQAAEDDGPSPVEALGLKKLSLQELKDKSPTDLLAFAESLEIENANSMRKQDMMFAILKTLAEEGVEISGSGTLEV